MPVDRWPVEFRYISRRLVHQIVQQEKATRSRWRHRVSLPGFGGGTISFERESLDWDNYFLLCREATEAVSDLTGTIDQGWNEYARAQLDLTMGYLTVLMGWDDVVRVDIAAMKAEVNSPKYGNVLIALFGSASNYVFRKPQSDELTEIPSDVDGLYGIVDRTREANDPLIADHYLDRDLGHDPESRADTAVRLLGVRFKGFREGRFDLLLKMFCSAENVGDYDRVVLGAPVWVSTLPPELFKRRSDRRKSPQD